MEKSNLSRSILSDIITFSKYSKYNSKLKRRETWEELIDRNKLMYLSKFPKLKLEIEEAYEFVYKKKILASGRSLQFAGKPMLISPTRGYNCAYTPLNHPIAFAEVMFLLLGGSGVGVSVQNHHVRELPELLGPKPRRKRHLIGDSIEGWSDAIKVLFNSYYYGKAMPVFDFDDIRDKGSLLKTSGGRAPGPQPLKDCIYNIKKILDLALYERGMGTKLIPLEVHDLVCHIADCVLSGGIRRASIISLFSMSDDKMLTCKFGKWWELNPQRARANNSVVILRNKVREKTFNALWEKIKSSGSGEPGIFLSHDKSMGCNPCCEVSLEPNSFCNLTTINSSNIIDQDDLNTRAIMASRIATLQATFTDFHYLRDIWKEQTEKDALIGVSMTGIASGNVLKLDIEQASKLVATENKRMAKLLGINPSKRSTSVKPEGTSSLVLGCSSGIGGWHAPHYIRRLRLNKEEAIYKYLKRAIPDLIEDDVLKSKTDAVVSIPIKAPDGAIFSSESPIDLLERVKLFHSKWISPTHEDGNNQNNVSVTVLVKEDEWDIVGKWMWDNRDSYNGISVLPYTDHSYVQAPFEECTEEIYNSMLEKVRHIDLTKVIEEEDNTKLKEEASCSGGQCTVTNI